MSTIGWAGLAETQEAPVAEHFAFTHYERLSGSRRVYDAQADAERMFPPGSSVAEFERTLTASGAKCAHGTDHDGSYSSCIYAPRRLSIVETDWTVSAHLDSPNGAVRSVRVTRYVTGP